MKVKELIEKLNGFDLESEIKFSCEIEIGRSSSFVNDGKLRINLDEEGVKILVWGEEEDFD